MKREWKPGDVALVETGCHANRRVAIRTGVPSNMGWAYSDTHDGRSTQNWAADSSGIVSVVRPLVVIDPEDREQVERLRDLFDVEVVRQNDNPDPRDVTPGARGNALQAALREFANPTPPKPEEPTGLGAVVEDADGKKWFRMALENQTWPGEVWQEQYDNADRWSQWQDIAVARVLSEGVTA